MKQKRKKSLLAIFVRTVSIIVGIFILFGGAAVFALRHYLGGVERQDVNHEVLQINQELEKYKEMKIVNLALFGLDASEGGNSRSDAIMIVSIDPARGKLKMVSVARDSYVSIPGSSEKTKINHAYAYGGPELAVATLNENFKLDITDYITVDFEKMADIINELGGVSLEISEAERQQINEYRDPKSPKLAESGYVSLNGEQAVAYGRIRKIGGDDERTNRQRRVLELLFQKLIAVSPVEYPSYVKKFSPMIVTSLTDGEILKLATVAMSNKTLTLEQGALPNEYVMFEGQKLGEGQRINKIWYYVYDIDLSAEMLEKFIYDDIPFGADMAGTDEEVLE